LNLDEETVAKWARAKNYTKGGGKTLVRKSKLEPYKISRRPSVGSELFPHRRSRIFLESNFSAT